MTDDLPGFLHGWPVWVVFVVLALGGYARGNATYWVGRGVRAGGDRSRLGRYAGSPLVRAAEGWVRRFGGPLVAVGFLTIGVQTAIVLAAGLLRMPQRRFQPAVVAGALLWAGLYTTVGFAILESWLGQIEWWWALVGLGLIVVHIGVSRAIRRRTVQEAGGDDA